METKPVITISRKTKETDITVKLNLYGTGIAVINTGVGFFDHMLTALTVHGGFDLELQCVGDLDVDSHHTIEDVGIVLGLAFDKALGDKGGIARYGSFYVPMDEALGFVSLDISGRPYLVFNCEFKSNYMGAMETQMVEEFFRALSYNSKITLHANVMYGQNDHHKTEALFKALAHALKQALVPLASNEVLSTKGAL